MNLARWKPIHKTRRNLRSLAWALRNVRNRGRIRREVLRADGPIGDLSRYERRVTSQNGEDGILEALFAALGPGTRTFVEFGAGRRCNALRLASEEGWTGLWMDARGGWEGAPLPVRSEFVTAENVESLFDRYDVPAEPDLLSIDIDGNDYWVWRAIRTRRPRVVLVEQNAALGPEQSLVVPYGPAFEWDGTDWFGASLAALARLGRSKGYGLVGSDASGTNAFFVRSDLLAPRLREAPAAAAWRAPRWSAKCPWPCDDRPRTEVGQDGEPTGRLLVASRSS